jgi:hypothetical protein
MQRRALLLAFATSIAGAQGAERLRRFSLLELEIENKRNEKGRKIPDEFIPALRDQVLAAIAAEHRFYRIGDYTDPAVSTPQGDSSAVLMRLRIVDYTGSQNTAGVTAVIHFLDKETGKEIFQERLRAQLRYDNGALSAALRKLARLTAQLIRDGW